MKTNVTHQETEIRAALSEAQDAQWHRLDAAAKKAARPPAKPAKPAKVAPKRPVVPRRNFVALPPVKLPTQQSLPEGSLILNADEVQALDHLLSTHPLLRDTK